MDSSQNKVITFTEEKDNLYKYKRKNLVKKAVSCVLEHKWTFYYLLFMIILLGFIWLTILEQKPVKANKTGFLLKEPVTCGYCRV